MTALRGELARHKTGKWPAEISKLVRKKLQQQLGKQLKLNPIKSYEIDDAIDYAKYAAYELLFDIVRNMLKCPKDACKPGKHLEDIDLHDEEPLELLALEVFIGPERTLRLIDAAIAYMKGRYDKPGAQDDTLPIVV